MFSIPKEILTTTKAFWQFGRSLSFTNLLNDLGPVYGKAVQTALSQLPLPQFSAVYDAWPPIKTSKVAEILSTEQPGWEKKYELDDQPLGVASVGQVHGLTDRVTGESWVVKVIKPGAKKRMFETTQTILDILDLSENLPFIDKSTQLIDLCHRFRDECDLKLEGDTIRKVRQNFSRRQGVRVPKVKFASTSVLVIEKFSGTPLSKIIHDPDKLGEKGRKRLARLLVSDILVQVFELGLFHADPHAGNFILLEDESVGLFDWGLSGELSDFDRRIISGVLRSVIAKDLNMLTDVLLEMCPNGDKKRVEKKLEELRKKLKGEKKIHKILNESMQTASELGMMIPKSLLLMVKTIITIEGLAKGLDPQVSMKNIAAPIVWRNFKPGMKELFSALVKRWS